MSSSTRITGQTFINFLISGDKNHLPSKNTEFYLISDFLKIHTIKIHEKISELKDFNFDEGVEFIGYNFSKVLKLVNCKGRGGIKFINCSSKSITEGDPRPDIEFINFTFDHLSFETCNLKNGILLKKNIEKNDPNILSSITAKACSFGGDGFQIESTKINHGIYFKNVDESTSFLFRNVETGDYCKFESCQVNGIHFSGENLKLNKGLIFERPNLHDLRFTEGTINDDLEIIEPRISGILSFNSIRIGGKTNISGKKQYPYIEQEDQKNNVVLPQILINSTDFNEGFSIEGEGKVSKSISIDFSLSLKGRFVFSNIKLGKLFLKGTNSESNLYFRNMGFEEIMIDDFLNLKTISFTNLDDKFTKSKNSTFKILDSDLGNWELANFDFDSFSKITWRDSNITDLKTSAVNWFADNKFETEGETHRLTCFRRREFYRQLKVSSQKQGHRIAELEFKGREINAHRKGLKTREEKRFDRWAILAGETNDHGQNWLKPLGCIILITTVFFFPLYFIADSEISFWPNFSIAGWKLFWCKFSEHSPVWTQLFNPARRVSDMFKEIEHPFWVYFLDGLQRIILAFFIFQIVSAFRKFVK